MKELFKSKCMIGFLVLMVGFLFMSAGNVQKMEENENNDLNTYLAYNS